MTQLIINNTIKTTVLPLKKKPKHVCLNSKGGHFNIGLLSPQKMKQVEIIYNNLYILSGFKVSQLYSFYAKYLCGQ